MSEWLKEHAWKACVGETLPWVRIPLSPPSAAAREWSHASYGGWLADMMRSAVALKARRWTNPTLSASSWRNQNLPVQRRDTEKCAVAPLSLDDGAQTSCRLSEGSGTVRPLDYSLRRRSNKNNG